MNSHEWARQLHLTADFLLAQPEFSTPLKHMNLYVGNYFSDKAGFLAMVRALGPVTKEYDSDELEVRSVRSPLELWARILRDSVCVRIQEEKWECQSLLSPEEEAQVGVEFKP